MRSRRAAAPQVVREQLDLPGAEVALISGLFTSQEAAALLGELVERLAWRQEHVRLFGEVIASPRLTAWYGDAGAVYTYSGLTLEPRPWLAPLVTIKKRVEDELGVEFNGVLANLYRDGSDSMGWHSDDERELGPDPTIASVSFGEVRRFALRRREGGQSGACAVDLEHGSLVVMAGATQRHYRHRVAKTRRRCGPRVNLSFRRVLLEAKR